MQGKLLHVVLHCTVVAGLGTPSDKDGAKLLANVLILVIDIAPSGCDRQGSACSAGHMRPFHMVLVFG
jgi:hypothetical protein